MNWVTRKLFGRNVVTFESRPIYTSWRQDFEEGKLAEAVFGELFSLHHAVYTWCGGLNTKVVVMRAALIVLVVWRPTNSRRPPRPEIGIF